MSVSLDPIKEFPFALSCGGHYSSQISSSLAPALAELGTAQPPLVTVILCFKYLRV